MSPKAALEGRAHHAGVSESCAAWRIAAFVPRDWRGRHLAVRGDPVGLIEVTQKRIVNLRRLIFSACWGALQILAKAEDSLRPCFGFRRGFFFASLLPLF